MMWITSSQDAFVLLLHCKMAALTKAVVLRLLPLCSLVEGLVHQLLRKEVWRDVYGAAAGWRRVRRPTPPATAATAGPAGAPVPPTTMRMCPSLVNVSGLSPRDQGQGCQMGCLLGILGGTKSLLCLPCGKEMIGK